MEPVFLPNPPSLWMIEATIIVYVVFLLVTFYSLAEELREYLMTGRRVARWSAALSAALIALSTFAMWTLFTAISFHGALQRALGE